MSLEKTLPLREEVPEEFTWRLEDIYATDEEWEDVFQQTKKRVSKLVDFKGTLGESPEQLLDYLKYQDQVFLNVKQLYIYARMRHDEDVTKSFYQGINERSSQLFSEALNQSSFFRPEVLSISEGLFQSFLEYEGLQEYRHMLEKINRNRPHILNASQESFLAQAAEVMMSSSNIYSALSNADMRFPSVTNSKGEEIEVTHGRYIHFMESGDRILRKNAFHSMYETFERYKNTISGTLAGAIKKNNFEARIRNYDSARQASLGSNHIPENVYDQLINTVESHLHLLHRYMDLKKKALRYDQLHMYDIYTPLIKNVDFKVSYAESQEILKKALAPLGDEYLSILQKSFNNRWIDVMENKGKRSGAYSSGVYGTNPYILLNWQDNIINLFTLAHEFGHSAHSYLSNHTQPYIYSNYTIFVAEVASTCNEALLTHYLSTQVTDVSKRLFLVNRYLEGFRATVFRQAMFAEYEHLIHEKAKQGEALTPDRLCTWYYDLNKKYFSDRVVSDDLISMEWARIPHFYLDFYVYQYATGFAAATALSKQILEEGQPAVDRYIHFLKSGSSDYPIELLKKAGVDVSSPKPLQDAFQLFESKLDELEQLLLQ